MSLNELILEMLKIKSISDDFGEYEVKFFDNCKQFCGYSDNGSNVDSEIVLDIQKRLIKLKGE